MPHMCVACTRYEEARALREMQFNFSDKPTPARHAQNIASTMQTCPGPQTLLAVHHVPLEYDADAIHAVLSELRPDNVRCMWSSKLFQVGPESLSLSVAKPLSWFVSWHVACLHACGAAIRTLY